MAIAPPRKRWFNAAMTAKFAYKLLTAEDAAKADADGQTAAAVDLADGYVHLSTRAQLAETARRYFSNAPGAVLLEYELSSLGDVRWEPSRGGDLFPHLYGALSPAAASRRWTLPSGTDGAPVLPGNLKP